MVRIFVIKLFIIFYKEMVD